MKNMKNHENITTYIPDCSIKKGYINIFKEIFSEIIQNKWLTFQLFKRDFLTLYKQSLVGILWIFIVPLVSVGTFMVLNRSGIFITGDIPVPYPIYAISGIALWQLFATGLVSTANSLVLAGGMITRIKFSKKSLVFASYGQAIVSFLIQILILAVLFAYFKIRPGIAIIFLPVIILPIILLSLGFGFILSLLNGIIRDIGNALLILLTFCMFITPVLYVKPATGMLSVLTKYNILYYIVSVPRNFILTGIANSLPDIKGFFISAILSFAIFVICLVIFHLTETRVAERI